MENRQKRELPDRERQAGRTVIMGGTAPPSAIGDRMCTGSGQENNVYGHPQPELHSCATILDAGVATLTREHCLFPNDD
ncbi:hypothetical protein NDU88_001042 [Pleurodeles waltl]|uniref:Uncharacterized protein n=1 Tax=Pleurodeles waltl TaxID=8319 RepID=A0AAV7LGE4_PLEWA|nr:hypothetical protein NDU88_001042 [Pleurodeles waltl]